VLLGIEARILGTRGPPPGLRYAGHPMAEPALTLNSTWLRNRVAELGLRQWWLAEQVGVDRKTVLRWVNGQVRSIQPANARVLAGVLGCRVDEMLLQAAAQQLASPEDQRAAGLALAASTLMDRLGPVGEWNVIEQLVRAAAVPDLPLHVLGRLYHQLCVACWRQDKLDDAARHNDAALALARRCDDRALLGDALGSRANLQFWRGELPTALASWAEALALSAWLTPRQRGSLHSNLGASLVEAGLPVRGGAELQAALACFAIEGTPMNLSIVHGHLALLALEGGDAGQAEHEAARSLGLARQADYRRGLALAPLLQAHAAALQGRPAPARALLAQGLQAFADMGVDDALNHVLAARIERTLGDGAAALAAAQRAFQRAAGFPLEQAAALHEQALAQALLGQGAAAAASRQGAAALYTRCGAFEMAARLA
jgi:hypothetical protein